MKSSEITGGGPERTQGENLAGVPGERMQRLAAPRAGELFSVASHAGLVPTIHQRGASESVHPGSGGPPRMMGEVQKDREPEDKPALVRAMAKRVLEERQLDLQAVYGLEQPAADVLDHGIERSRAFIALETLNFYDDPYDIRKIANASIIDDDLRERSEFVHLDDNDLRTQAEIMRRELGLRLVEIHQEVRDPEIDIYRRLRIKADEVLEDKPDRQIADVFSDPDLYRQMFTGLYASVGEFVAEQQEIITDKDYLGMIIALEARDPNLRVVDLEKAAAAYELADRAKAVARARRMWGDDAFDALSPDIRSQLPELPLENTRPL